MIAVLLMLIAIGFVSFAIYMHRTDKRLWRELIDEIKRHPVRVFTPNPATIDSGTVTRFQYDGTKWRAESFDPEGK